MRITSKLISFVLVIAMLITCTSNALAAPVRNPGKVNYLSKVAIIEAANDEEAQKLLAELQKDENGGFTNMIALDLNKGGQKKVYLVYKTSNNVDDAITDLSIMNMDGNYTMGNYEQALAENMDKYAAIARDYRAIAAAFAANYAAGNVNAKTAYRQLNLYYIEENGVKTYMGDYMLNFPATDEGFAEILFRGNLKIIANIRDLMAMGIGNGEDALADRIAAAFVAAESDPSVYSVAAYEEAAKAMLEDFLEMKKSINTLDDEIAKIDADTTMDDESKTFTKDMMKNSLDVAKAYLELLREIPMGQTTLGDYIMDTAVPEANKLFPAVAAATDVERLLMEYHSLYTVLLYTQLSLAGEALEEALQELEADVEPLSVFHGVQNDMVTGTIGVTGDAENYSNASGKSFFGMFVNDDTQVNAILFSVMGVAGVGSMLGGFAYLNAKINALDAANKITKEGLEYSLKFAQDTVRECKRRVLMESSKQLNGQGGSLEKIAELKTKVAEAKKEVTIAEANLKNAPYKELTGKQVALGGGLILAGAVMIGLSIAQLVRLYNQYKISYADIPDNMVHVVSHRDGDRFVNYKNVPAYYYDEKGALATRENDLNAYDGRQWVSLYYTKNYEAGYCLTASPDLIATEAGKTGYTSIHLFGRSDGYNTNSYCNRENAEAVYLAFKYSTNQKSAVTDVPEIIGSVFNAGTIAISAFAGFTGGVVLMYAINKKKAKTAKATA